MSLNSASFLNFFLLLLLLASFSCYRTALCDTNTTLLFVVWYIMFLLIVINLFIMNQKIQKLEEKK